MKEFYLKSAELHTTTKETHFTPWQKFFRSLSFVAHPRGRKHNEAMKKTRNIPKDKRLFVNSLWSHNIEVKGTKAFE